jgi:glycosyltransferase involved in cell wall biosynthesis
MKVVGTARPDQSAGRISRRPEQILLLCFYDPAGISTVPETVAFMQANSRFSITVVNLAEHGRNGTKLALTENFNLKKFTSIIIHNTLSYNVDNLYSLDEVLDVGIKDFAGVKVLMKQDENYRFREIAKYIGDYGYDLIFTCLPPESIPIVYPEHLVGRPTFSRMLTGYVTPTLRQSQLGASAKPIDIGYRGSIQPLSFGWLAYEKRKIGYDVNRLLSGRDLSLDISSRWEDRIGGDQWLHFLASCKATLGAESGASVFDLDGDLSARCERAEQRLGPFSEDVSYAESYLAELADLEGNVKYNQVSPRHFEAVATRTLQILFPGSYSDIFMPGRHYVPLRRDYSNLDDLVDLVRDDRRRIEITTRAYEEIVEARDYWIETFVEQFDTLLFDALSRKNALLNPIHSFPSDARNVLVLAAHQPSLDPRFKWIAEGAPQSLRVIQFGIVPEADKIAPASRSANGHLTITEVRRRFEPNDIASWFRATATNDAGRAGLAEIELMARALDLDENAFLEFVLAPEGSQRVVVFRSLLQYFLDTTATIVSAGLRMRGLHGIIAADLDTLPAALILKGIFNVSVFYDAHEFWPEAEVGSFEFERQYWMEMEGRLVRHADRRQTVSSGLAALMGENYGCKFDVVPNCEPLQSCAEQPRATARIDSSCHFIFQGGFAAARGLDLLVDVWPETHEQAILLLRGPDNAYKLEMIERAQKTGLLGTRILFPEAVSEAELIPALQDGDVGLISYTPTGKNYTHCCPNKMSQYMAAGVPILANATRFIKSIIEESQSGIVVDFSRRKDLIASVARLTEDREARVAMGRRGNEYFRNSFNWERRSVGFYQELTKLTSGQPEQVFEFFPSLPQEVLYRKKSGPRSAAGSNLYPVIRRLWRLLPAAVQGRVGPPLMVFLRGFLDRRTV